MLQEQQNSMLVHLGTHYLSYDEPHTQMKSRCTGYRFVILGGRKVCRLNTWIHTLPLQHLVRMCQILIGLFLASCC